MKRAGLPGIIQWDQEIGDEEPRRTGSFQGQWRPEPRGQRVSPRRQEGAVVMVASESEPQPEVRSAEKPLVLCVDDERPILAALARVLRREPYQVMMTDDPEEALHQVRSRFVSLILVDYRMPALSGTGLLQMVKAASPSTIRIMLTGYPQDAWIRASEENGLMQVCRKPWDDEGLRQVLREQLHRGRE